MFPFLKKLMLAAVMLSGILLLLMAAEIGINSGSELSFFTPVQAGSYHYHHEWWSWGSWNQRWRHEEYSWTCWRCGHRWNYYNHRNCSRCGYWKRQPQYWRH